MPSEIVKNENEINVEAKEVMDNINTVAETKNPVSLETKTKDEVQVNKSEELETCEDLSEGEKKTETETEDEVQVNNKSEEKKTVSLETKTEDEVQVNKSEELDACEDLSEGEKETKTEDEVQVNNTPDAKKTVSLETEDEMNKSEELESSDDLSESENKENEEPIEVDIETLKKRADDLFFDGKRHLIIKDFQAAADVLSETCSLYGTIYGEMAEECAEVYFIYGCALLELSKDEISPIGLEPKDDEEYDIDDLVVSEQIVGYVAHEEDDRAYYASKANKVDEKKSEVVKSTEKSEQIEDEEKPRDEIEDKSTKKDEKVEEEMVADEDKTEEEKMVADEDKTEKEEMDADKEKPDGDDIEEDEVNDLQLAWEMFDLAKVIYKNKDTDESKLKLAEILMKCGEVSIEGEKFEMAIQDMTESLAIRRLLLPEDSRIIAETLFQLGIAEELAGSGDRAVELLTDAATVLNQRITILEKSTDDSAKNEMNEIKAIIPEIMNKIVDIKERKKAAVNAFLAAIGDISDNKKTIMNGEAATSSTTKQTSNISHLVRKRPKQEEETDGTPNKISKLEELAATKQ